MLDTAYYNERLVDLRLSSDFNGAIASLVNAIGVLDSIVIGCLAEEAARTGSPVAALEALGDFVSQGTGKVSTIVFRIYKAIYDAGVWVLNMIKNMLIYAAKGFPGTIGGAIRTVKKIGDRIADMQNVVVPTGVSPAIATRAAEIVDEHAKYVDVKLSNGRIDKAKQQYLSDFNASMKSDARVNNAFVCTAAPGPLGKVKLKECNTPSSAELVSVGETLVKAEPILKKRLNTLQKEGAVVKSVIKTMKSKGFKDKSVNNANSVQVLAAAYHAAILANDMKYIHLLEKAYTDMAYSLKKSAKKYVA